MGSTHNNQPELDMMSEAEHGALQELHDATQKWGGIMKGIKALIVGAFVLGMWVASLELRHRGHDEKLDRLEQIQLENHRQELRLQHLEDMEAIVLERLDKVIEKLDKLAESK